MLISTFMSEAFEERHIIQPQHLTDVLVVCQNRQLVCRVLEEQVIFLIGR